MNKNYNINQYYYANDKRLKDNGSAIYIPKHSRRTKKSKRGK